MKWRELRMSLEVEDQRFLDELHEGMIDGTVLISGEKQPMGMDEILDRLEGSPKLIETLQDAEVITLTEDFKLREGSAYRDLHAFATAVEELSFTNVEINGDPIGQFIENEGITPTGAEPNLSPKDPNSIAGMPAEASQSALSIAKSCLSMGVIGGFFQSMMGEDTHADGTIKNPHTKDGLDKIRGECALKGVTESLIQDEIDPTGNQIQAVINKAGEELQGGR